MSPARWLAWLALVSAAASVLVLLTYGGLRSLVLLGIGAAGVAVSLAGVWGFLTSRGLRRWLAAAVVLTAPAVVAVWYAGAGLVWVFIASAVLWAAAGGLGRAALAYTAPGPQPEYETPPPDHPYLIMNPRSGDGKVARFRLAELARDRGAEVALLPADREADVAALARAAVRGGADLLGVAGGDGTQALVAEVAAEHGVPFLVLPAGTRNHLAMDLGLDRDDPAAALDALTDGVELRVDLGRIGGRTFVNNASFGAYAAVVQSPAYRAAKARTALDLLPDVLAGRDTPPLRLRAGGTAFDGPQAVLVSNNAYAPRSTRRARLDRGRLGVLVVAVSGAAAAAGLVRGGGTRVVTIVTAGEVVVESDAAAIAVGVDGEALRLAPPVRCEVRPGALRVRVPRYRPGGPAPARPVDWGGLWRLALHGTGSPPGP